MKKRIGSFLLACCLMLSLITNTTVYAANNVQSGVFGRDGDSLAWSLSNDGTLTISGTGQMPTVEDSPNAPWYSVRSKIKKAIVEDGVADLMINCFSGCSNLTQVSLGNTITSIGIWAFYQCSKLTSVTVPASVSQIESGAFGNCTGLQEINVDTSNADFASIEGVLFSRDGKTLRAYPSGRKDTSYAIPDGVETIGDISFAFNHYVKEISIPDSVTTIETDAFFDCTKLTQIVIPESVTTLGMDVFGQCTSLKSVSIPVSITAIAKHTFYKCSKLTDVYYSGTAEQWQQVSIDNTDKGNEQLYKAKIHCDDGSTAPATKNRCGDNLTYTIEDGIFTISGTGPMWNYDVITNYPGWFMSSSIKGVKISEGVTTIGSCAFGWLFGLKTLEIPRSVVSIGADAFNNSRMITDIYYAGTEAEWKQIKIASGNYTLDNATIHYGGSGQQVPDVPTLPTQNDDISIKEIGIKFFPNHAEVYDNFKVDWGWSLFKNSSKNYNVNLAKAGLALSAAAEHSQDATEEMLYELGFKDQRDSVNYGEAISNVFRPGVSFGHQKVTENGVEYHYFAIVVRGTTSTGDVITDIASLVDGFSIAGTTLTSQFRDFVSKDCGLSTSDIQGKSRFFITGHSLGGATANNIAKSLSDTYGESNVFAYTFASPGTSMVPSISSYMNIHNIINKEDGWPKTPLVHRFRYGREERFHRNDNADKGFYDNYKELTGRVFDNDDAHAVETYMSYVLIKDSKFSSKISGVCWACPVDINIYTSNGQLAGSVKSDVVNNTLPDKICIFVEQQMKYVYFLEDGEYSFKVTSTGTGTMKYSILSIDTAACEILEEKAFSNIQLARNKQFASEIKVTGNTVTGTEKGSSEIKLYTINNAGELDKEVLPDGKGTEIPVGSSSSTPNKPSSNENSVTSPNNPSQQPGWNNPFRDVSAGSWYYEAVKYVNQNRLMNGTGSGIFEPETNLSRAMLIQILYNREGKPSTVGSSSFRDVSQSAWYSPAISWASKRGVATGYGSGLFGPEDNITREQLAVMLWRYLGSPASTGKTLQFSDANKVSDYAIEAMRWATENGVINGVGNNRLDPSGVATRAQAAQMFKNYFGK